MAGRPLGDAGSAHGLAHRPLDGRLVKVMPPELPGGGVVLNPGRRKDELPLPIFGRSHGLALEGARQRCATRPAFEVALMQQLHSAEMGS